MNLYKTLLLAIDLNEESHALLVRVRPLCQDPRSVVHVVHVLRDTSRFESDGSGSGVDADLKCEQDKARRRLGALLASNGFEIHPARLHVKYGEPANEIKTLAHQLAADLVVVGSHLRGRGWLSLPGPTTNCVLQGIDSDVMAVRV